MVGVYFSWATAPCRRRLVCLGDIALVTPLIDGMNLVAKEFVACQRENAGLLILSEFAGAAEELFNALLVNPYDSAAVAGTLTDALALHTEESRNVILPMRERVMRYDARHWARSFIDDLIGRSSALAGAKKDSHSKSRTMMNVRASGSSLN
jgi:trehalose-6-phosphate synthase